LRNRLRALKARRGLTGDRVAGAESRSHRAEYLGIAPVLSLYQRYSPALLFLTFTLAAVLPLVLRREQVERVRGGL
jgi:hypothetical protein